MQGNPVCIKYYKNLKEEEKYENKTQVICQSIQEARNGKKLLITKDNSKCTGGSYFVGLIEYSPKIIDFWVNIEKSHCNYCSAFTYKSSVPEPPRDVFKKISIEPAHKSIENPDIVIFFCNPNNISKLLGVHCYNEGKPFNIISYAAFCFSIIGVPMSTGNPHVSFIDNSARYLAEFRENELAFAIPFQKINQLSDSIDECIWGEKKEVPYHKIEKQFKGTWTNCSRIKD
jgi:uncharacterized protein (DUF169 family)